MKLMALLRRLVGRPETVTAEDIEARERFKREGEALEEIQRALRQRNATFDRAMREDYLDGQLRNWRRGKPWT